MAYPNIAGLKEVNSLPLQPSWLHSNDPLNICIIWLQAGLSNAEYEDLVLDFGTARLFQFD